MTNYDSGISLSAPSGFTPQVTEFTGELTSIFKNPEQRKDPKGGAYTVDVVNFDFGECEWIATTSPQLDSNFTVKVNYNEDKADTPWDVLRKSLVRFMPDDFNSDIMQFMGYRFHCKFDDIKLNKPDELGTWGLQDAKGWVVVGIDGLVNRVVEDAENSLQDLIVDEIINGNNEADAVMAFHQHEAIRSMNGYDKVLTEITNGTYLGSLAEAGVISVDDENTWHKVEN